LLDRVNTPLRILWCSLRCHPLIGLGEIPLTLPTPFDSEIFSRAPIIYDDAILSLRNAALESLSLMCKGWGSNRIDVKGARVDIEGGGLRSVPKGNRDLSAVFSAVSAPMSHLLHYVISYWFSIHRKKQNRKYSARGF